MKGLNSIVMSVILNVLLIAKKQFFNRLKLGLLIQIFKIIFREPLFTNKFNSSF